MIYDFYKCILTIDCFEPCSWELSDELKTLSFTVVVL